MGDQVKARAELVLAEHVNDTPGDSGDDPFCGACGEPWPCLPVLLARDVLLLLEETLTGRAEKAEAEVAYERERNQTNVLAYSEQVKGLEAKVARLTAELNAVNGHWPELRRLRDENARLREALQYYAEQRNFRLSAGDTCPEHGHHVCAMEHRDSYDHGRPGSRARCALDESTRARIEAATTEESE